MLFETPLPLLNLGHLRGLSAVHVVFATNSAIGSTAVRFVVLLADGQPTIQTLGPEQQRERAAKLPTHRTVQNEVDCGIEQRQQIHEIAYE